MNNKCVCVFTQLKQQHNSPNNNKRSKETKALKTSAAAKVAAAFTTFTFAFADALVPWRLGALLFVW